MSINIESSYSFHGSLIKKEDLINFKNLGYNSLGLVDNTTAFFITFYIEMKKIGINPILGFRTTGSNYDYILYAKNYDGYKDILRFASSINNKYPVSFDSLVRSKNLYYVFDLTFYETTDIKIIEDEYKELVEEGLSVILGVDFSYYPCEALLYPIIKDHFPIVIIEKAKYLNKEDKKASEILEAILSNSELKESNLFDMDMQSSFALKTYDSFKESYKEYKELISDTNKFRDSINIDIEFKTRFPHYETKNSVPSDIYLRALSNKGLSKRLEGTNKDVLKYKERLKYELSIIHSMGFDDYFLVVYDYILYAKKNNIYVGPGRGSAASSLVSYSLGIVDVDPLEYNLYFERFLNPERKTMPDIDTDFEDSKRDQVIKYVISKYGEYHVSLISTFQTFLAKSAIREVSKYFDIPEITVATIARNIDSDENTIDSLLKKKSIQHIINNQEEVKRLLEVSKKIEGLPKSIGTHAAGVIISDNDLREYSEVHPGLNDFLQSTYDADSLKEIGLLKMDFLSLRNLSILHEIVNDIKINSNIQIDLNKIPLDDKKTFKLLREKPTTGIFQFESKGMTNLLKAMKIDNFLDLSICLSLYRPGPMDNIPEYLKRREGKVKIDYYDDSLKKILKETLGIIVYQEQIMAIVQVYSGLTLAEGDILRRAISKKNSELILKFKDKFFEGANNLNRDLKTTERLFNDIYKFSDYGFNKSHAIVYAKIAYELAYLKANYPKEFMSNLLMNSPSSMVNKYIKETQELGLRVLSPDLRYSSIRYQVKGNSIYMPFTEIRGIGYDYAMRIIELKKEGHTSFESFVENSKDLIPREIVEDLIFSGVFDYTSYNKKTMIQSLDGLYEFNSTFIKGMKSRNVVKTDEYDFDFLKNKEYELLGFNSKYHPIKKYTGELDKISDIELDTVGARIIAYLTNLKIIKTKNGESMAQFYLEDEFMSVKGVLFPKDYFKCAHYIKNNTLYEILGSYKENRGEPQFVIREIKESDV